jgi:benzoyl-CoA reductase subunit D
MSITAGIDVGTSAVKVAVLRHGPDGHQVVGRRNERLRHRDARTVVSEAYAGALSQAGAAPRDVAYLATTGEGDFVDGRTGHFYGMTAHARGGLELVPGATAVLDVGALHARAIVIDGRGRVLRHRMTSQCASGSGQFLENIGRYLGVAVEEIGSLSQSAGKPETCSSICAVLAETDVINMVSRGLAMADILKGIHLSMAGRLVKLLQAAGAEGIVSVSGGLALDTGLAAALTEEAARSGAKLVFATHPDAPLAGALGAALWGQYRLERLAARGETALAAP